MRRNNANVVVRMVAAMLVLGVSLGCGMGLFRGKQTSFGVPGDEVKVLTADGGAPMPPAPWKTALADGGAPMPPAPWAV